jgi:hypothetical protein
VDGVVGQDGHAVVFLDAQVRRALADPVGGGLQFGVGEGCVPEDDRLLVRDVVGGAPDHVGDDPAVDPVVAVHEKSRFSFPC